MKVRFTFKTPDVIRDGTYDFLREYNLRMERADVQNLSQDDVDSILEEKEREIMDEARQWFKWSEFVTIELDTEAHTATVIKPT